MPVSKPQSNINMYRNIAINKAFENQVYRGLFQYIKTQNADINRVSTRMFKQDLPRQPVPTLENTIKKFILSAKPFLNESQIKTTTELAKKFAEGPGSKLQELLIAKAKETENWLAAWWLNAAYLDFRSPVVVYSSPGLVYPFVYFKNETEKLMYAAKIISAALDYKLIIDQEKMIVDKMGKDPLDMNQYKKVFGTCRIPGTKRDSLEYHSRSKHIIVMHKNNFFKVDVFSGDNNMLSINQLFKQLEEAVKQSASVADPIGVLTATDRDSWGAAYEVLIKDPTNKQNVLEIQQSLFLMCLDGPMPKKNVTPQILASEQLIHGGGGFYNAPNRWYDKTIQFVIGDNGINGLTYEHSPAEGQPIAVMTDYLLNVIKKDGGNSIPDAKFEGKPLKLTFKVDKELQSHLDKAISSVDKLAENLQLDSVTFKEFGKNFIKSQKLSPDSFIQVAMQYAFYRIHKEPGAHYESAATRKYLHGRTETIRSCTVESVEFAKTMLNPNASNEDKIRTLRAAVDAHKKYTVDALHGFGVDRHFLGLKLMALERKQEIHPIYSDPGYVRSSNYRISSSQVATKCDGFMCYGPITDDGYACCYNPRDDTINMACAVFTSHPDTNATTFRENMEKSLMDMHNVLAQTQKCKL